jgi:RNA polymerase sigma-70 factor (ECF subfamily)
VRCGLAASYSGIRRSRIDQDIWLGVWQALPRFRGECSERTFVFRIAHNRAVSHVDHWHRRRTDSLDEDAPLAASQPDPEHALSIEQRRERLQAAVQSLPIGLRQVVVFTWKASATPKWRRSSASAKTMWRCG